MTTVGSGRFQSVIRCRAASATIGFRRIAEPQVPCAAHSCWTQTGLRGVRLQVELRMGWPLALALPGGSSGDRASPSALGHQAVQGPAQSGCCCRRLDRPRHHPWSCRSGASRSTDQHVEQDGPVGHDLVRFAPLPSRAGRYARAGRRSRVLIACGDEGVRGRIQPRFARGQRQQTDQNHPAVITSSRVVDRRPVSPSRPRSACGYRRTAMVSQKAALAGGPRTSSRSSEARRPRSARAPCASRSSPSRNASRRARPEAISGPVRESFAGSCHRPRCSRSASGR